MLLIQKILKMERDSCRKDKKSQLMPLQKDSLCTKVKSKVSVIKYSVIKFKPGADVNH